MTGQLTARYFKADGKAGSNLSLPSEPFDGVVHEESMYAAVTAYLANQRQGTASAKTRSEVSGGGRKPYRQKGTGRARHGTIRSPIWRGGGIVFAPEPRSYRRDLPKKVRRLARRSAFNARAAEDRVVVVEDLKFEAPKTRRLVQLLDKIGAADTKILILTNGKQKNVYLSARNIQNVEVRPYGDESTYDVLWADTVLIEEGALSGGGQPAKPSAADSEEASDA
jgi:large subunit ribosomal protein L4